MIISAILASFSVVNVGAISAQSAVMIDGLTGQVLYDKDGETERLIASTTKIMTGLLVAESGKLEEKVTITADMVDIEGSSLYLKVGEVLTVEQLLYGLMLRSGNDAAMALALEISGNLEEFVLKMNEKAVELGLEHTHFANPHGLDDDGNYATALDLATLTAYAMKNDDFRQVCSTKSMTVGSRVLQNHNKMLWRYDGAIGVKTGYTQAAGRLLVTAAERKNRTLIAVTMNAPDDWNDHQVLLDNGFDRMKEEFAVTAGTVMGQVPIIGGTTETVNCIAGEDGIFGLFSGETVEIILYLPEFAFAAVHNGHPAGYAKLLIDGRELGRVPLVYEKTVAQKIEPPQEKSWLEQLFGG
ncbi:MAG: D-alanyl-D-alanine carboxypeptidase family protein [Eubacteriales bacterium]